MTSNQNNGVQQSAFADAGRNKTKLHLQRLLLCEENAMGIIDYRCKFPSTREIVWKGETCTRSDETPLPSEPYSLLGCILLTKCLSQCCLSGGSVMALSMLTEKLDSAGRDSWPSDQAYLAIWGEGPPHQNFLAVRVPHLNLPSSTSKVCHSLAHGFHWLFMLSGSRKIMEDLNTTSPTTCHSPTWLRAALMVPDRSNWAENLHDQSSPRTARQHEQWILERVWVHASSLKTNCTMVRIQSAFHLRFHENERIWMQYPNNKQRKQIKYQLFLTKPHVWWRKKTQVAPMLILFVAENLRLIRLPASAGGLPGPPGLGSTQRGTTWHGKTRTM